MTTEEFLRDVCPNHTDTSKWNKSELLHILELYTEQLRTQAISGSFFYQNVEKLANEWKEKELGETTPYSPEAEIEAGMRHFLRWLKEQYKQ